MGAEIRVMLPRGLTGTIGNHQKVREKHGKILPLKSKGTNLLPLSDLDLERIQQISTVLRDLIHDTLLLSRKLTHIYQMVDTY